MRKLLSGISLVINTRNEEEHLADCILSARSFVQEIIVVDMESTDDTRKIAKKFGAKLYQHPLVGFVEPARNFGLQKPKREWTLLLDADERLTPGLAKQMLAHMSKGEMTGLKIPRKNIFFGHWMQHAAWWPDYQLRFFRTGSVVWPTDIHAQPSINGEVLTLPARENNALLHYNARDIASFVEKINRYSGHEKQWQHQPESLAAALHPAEEEFVSRLFSHQGYKDKTTGLILSKIMEFYRFLEFAKYWERAGKKEWFTEKEIKAHFDSASTEKLQQELKIITDSAFYRYGWPLYTRMKKLISTLKNHFFLR